MLDFRCGTLNFFWRRKRGDLVGGVTYGQTTFAQKTPPLAAGESGTARKCVESAPVVVAHNEGETRSANKCEGEFLNKKFRESFTVCFGCPKNNLAVFVIKCLSSSFTNVYFIQITKPKKVNEKEWLIVSRILNVLSVRKSISNCGRDGKEPKSPILSKNTLNVCSCWTQIIWWLAIVILMWSFQCCLITFEHPPKLNLKY